MVLGVVCQGLQDRPSANTIMQNATDHLRRMKSLFSGIGPMIEQVLIETAEDHGVSVGMILGLIRMKEATAVRVDAARRLAEKGVTQADIARILRKDRTTVRYYLQGRKKG